MQRVVSCDPKWWKNWWRESQTKIA